ncbi:hypothetical protein RND81_02G098200 [Saponaria officinalis]|uniref:Uncharacterized protein n=1 Tax=Saponaria officinalis TaxID=3572 RepID=A0AAW1MSQ2_SAPOF
MTAMTFASVGSNTSFSESPLPLYLALTVTTNHRRSRFYSHFHTRIHIHLKKPFPWTCPSTAAQNVNLSGLVFLHRLLHFSNKIANPPDDNLHLHMPTFENTFISGLPNRPTTRHEIYVLFLTPLPPFTLHPLTHTVNTELIIHLQDHSFPHPSHPSTIP